MCNMYVTLQSVAVGILQRTRVQYNESNLSWGLQVQFHEAHQPILKKTVQAISINMEFQVQMVF